MAELFDGRYWKEELLGRGAFSEVWKVEDSLTHVTQALKIYAPATGMGSDGIEMLTHEFALMANVNHQNLLKPLSFAICDNRPYLVLRYCPKGNISKLTGKLTEQEAWRLIHDIGSALAYLHRQDPPIIHQDIKPDNILMSDDGSYLLTDFGVSTMSKNTLSRLSNTEAELTSAGTISYMAPEKFSRNNLPIMANDVYSLGTMVFEMVAGYLPFGNDGGLLQKKGADIPELPGDFSTDLKEVLDRCLQLNAWDRPTAAQLEELSAKQLFDQKTLSPFADKERVKKRDSVEKDHNEVTDNSVKEKKSKTDDDFKGTVIQGGFQMEYDQHEDAPAEPESPEPSTPFNRSEPLKENNKIIYAIIAAVVVVALSVIVYMLWSPKDDAAETISDTSVNETLTADTIAVVDTIKADTVTIDDTIDEGKMINDGKDVESEINNNKKTETTNIGKTENPKVQVTEGSTTKVVTDPPKPVHRGNLSFGSWAGSITGGMPDGQGTLTVTATHRIKCFNGKAIFVNAGDRIESAEFYDDGTLYQGTWIKANGDKVEILP